MESIGISLGPFCGRLQPSRRDVIPPGSFVCFNARKPSGTVHPGDGHCLQRRHRLRCRGQIRCKRDSLQVMPKEFLKQLNTPTRACPGAVSARGWPMDDDVLRCGDHSRPGNARHRTRDPLRRGETEAVHCPRAIHRLQIGDQ
jgi:hypothetical protein